MGTRFFPGSPLEGLSASGERVAGRGHGEPNLAWSSPPVPLSADAERGCGEPGTPHKLLADHDGAAHRGAVHGAIIRVATRRGERDQIGLTITRLDRAARETGRALRPDAVRHRSRGRPGPCDRAAHRDGVDRGVLAPVVGALEQDVPDDDLAGRTPAPTPATATATTVRGRRAARDRGQREQPDYRSPDTHLTLLGHSPRKGLPPSRGQR